ncbi:DUF3293 domain-containing protein [Cupriavidus sp. DF5525]|uniref:DUF3293 domain-containing protein n=1 Tax=Cupriavidus sp. DF5525 TaxID=3160989 RepID=UPI0032DFF518
MFSASAIPLDTIEAYRETHYHVGEDPLATLKVGEFCSALLVLHRAAEVDCSAFISACNPFSEQLDDAANAQRHAALEQGLRQRGFTILAGVGQHPSNGWPGEASFLVLGLSSSEARQLGVEYCQNAIVWAGADAVPELVLLR